MIPAAVLSGYLFVVLDKVHACQNLHQDAHEFLSQCLDQLKDDVEKMNKSLANEVASSSVAGEHGQEAAAAGKAEPGDEVDTSRVYTCPVAVNMEFEVQHTIICKV